jgi:shikimate dehydrogenase
VNATSIGLGDPEARLDLAGIPAGAVVADVIPNPPRTALIRDAEERGHVVLDGLGMLVAQGVISIRHWTGVDPDPAVMRHALEAALGV